MLTERRRKPEGEVMKWSCSQAYGDGKVESKEACPCGDTHFHGVQGGLALPADEALRAETPRRRMPRVEKWKKLNVNNMFAHLTVEDTKEMADADRKFLSDMGQARYEHTHQ